MRIGIILFYFIFFTGSKFHEIASFDTCIRLRPPKGFQRLEDSGNELCKKTNCKEIFTKAAPCQNIYTPIRATTQEYSFQNFKIFLTLRLRWPIRSYNITLKQEPINGSFTEIYFSIFCHTKSHLNWKNGYLIFASSCNIGAIPTKSGWLDCFLRNNTIR